MADLGELRAKISAEIDQFERGLDSAAKKADEFGKTTESAGKKGAAGLGEADKSMKLLSSAAKIGAAALAAAAVAMVKMTADAMKAADENAKLARKMGLTNHELAVLERAADLSGLSMGQLETSTRQLNRAMTDALDNTGRSAEAFETLGISIEDVIDLPMEEQMVALGDAFEGIESRAQRASLAQDLFGRSGMSMINLLEDARGTFERANDEVDRFGLALTEVESGAIERANDNIGTLKAAFGGLSQQMAATVAPAIERLTGNLIDLAEGFIKSRVELMEYMRAQERLNQAGEESATLEDRLTVALRERSRAQHTINTMDSRTGDLVRERNQATLAAAESEVRSIRDLILARDIAAAHAAGASEEEIEAIENTTDARTAQTEYYLNEWLPRVQALYASTEQGRREELENTLSWITKQIKAYSNYADMLEPIAANLREQLASMSPEDGPSEFEGREEMFTRQLEQLEEFLMSEEQLMQRSHERRIETVLQAMENMEITTSEAQRRIEALEQHHQDRLTEINRQAQQQRNQMAIMSSASIANNLVSFYSNATSATEKNERRLFEIRKNAATAQAFINTALGVTGALSSGRPWAWAEAAAFAAAGAAQVRAIQAQSFGGGGAPPPPPADQSGGDGGGAGGTERSLLIQSDFNSDSLFSGDSVRRLLDQIAEAQEDGYRVVL